MNIKVFLLVVLCSGQNNQRPRRLTTQQRYQKFLCQHVIDTQNPEDDKIKDKMDKAFRCPHRTINTVLFIDKTLGSWANIFPESLKIPSRRAKPGRNGKRPDNCFCSSSHIGLVTQTRTNRTCYKRYSCDVVVCKDLWNLTYPVHFDGIDTSTCNEVYHIPDFYTGVCAGLLRNQQLMGR